MARVRPAIARTWPLFVALIGLVGLGFAAWRWLSPDQDLIEEVDDEEPIVQPGEDEHFEKVRTHEIDEYTSYRGEVRGEGSVPVRAPQGMRVPVVDVHKEIGDFVSKGDPLVTFHREQIEKAIEKAKEQGDTESESRFRGYLESVVLRAPVDGVVMETYATVGQVPFDEGVPMMVLADRSSFTFVAQVPAEVTRISLHIGAQTTVDLAEERGSVRGTVASIDTGEGEDVNVVLSLEAHEGVEPGLPGTIRVVTGKKEVGVVPKTAVTWRGEVPVVRVWESDSRAIAERTLRIEGEVGDQYIVLYGVLPGEAIVVPGRERESAQR